MKILSRDFTLKEKILLLLLALVLIVLGYYQFIDKPCRRDIAEAPDIDGFERRTKRSRHFTRTTLMAEAVAAIGREADFEQIGVVGGN